MVGWSSRFAKNGFIMNGFKLGNWQKSPAEKIPRENPLSTNSPVENSYSPNFSELNILVKKIHPRKIILLKLPHTDFSSSFS